MFKQHLSSCALHSGPARWPMPCDCGGITDDRQPGSRSSHSDCTRGEALQSFVVLWSARISYLRENRESLSHYRQTVATRLGLGRHRDHNQQDEAQRF